MKSKPQSAAKPLHPSKITRASNKEISQVERVNESFLSSENSKSIFLKGGHSSARGSEGGFASAQKIVQNSRLSFNLSGSGGQTHKHSFRYSKREENNSAVGLLSNETSRIMNIPNEISLNASIRV